MPATSANAVVFTDDDMLQVAWANFGPRWKPFYPRILYPGDSLYYCPPKAEAMDIIKKSGVNKEHYISNSFDCDDYAYMLKAKFSAAAYENGARALPYCFGIVWSNNPGHAFNWMINDDGIMRFIEPQHAVEIAIDDYYELYLAMI